MKNVENNTNEHVYKLCDECLEYSESYNGYTVTISINKKSHEIDNANIKMDDNNGTNKEILMTFLDIIIGLPILEASDHGVIRLENILREKMQHSSVKGLIMPTNSIKFLQIPLLLIRSLYKNYSKDRDYAPLVNTYKNPLANEWENLDAKRKETLLKDLIFTFCDKNNIEKYEYKILRNNRIEFSVDKTLFPLLSKILFDMEIYISKKVGFTLEVMYIEERDINKRSKKGIINEK